MSTIERREPVTVPPLIAGERLDRATFHERYEAMPPQTRAELIGGVVHMPSPLSPDHAFTNAPVVIWLGPLSAVHQGGPDGASMPPSSSTIGRRRSPTS